MVVFQLAVFEVATAGTEQALNRSRPKRNEALPSHRFYSFHICVHAHVFVCPCNGPPGPCKIPARSA